MSHTVHELAKARIRRLNPDLDERQVIDQLIFELHGIQRDA